MLNVDILITVSRCIYKHSTCLGRSSRPSSGVQDCTYSNRYTSNMYCYLLASKQVARNTIQNM